jgi:hypothetical protein
LVNTKEHRREFDMHAETYLQILAASEATMAFNMGLQTAVYILEKAEDLSPEGRRFLIEELRKQITRSNG